LLLHGPTYSLHSVSVSDEIRTTDRREQVGLAAHGSLTALDAFFNPRSVAVIGATDREGSVGRTLLANLTNSRFQGKVYPVNPQHASLLGLPSFRSIGKVPAPVDLVIVATPAATVPAVIGECVDAQVKSAVVISAGFRETGKTGADLEEEIAEHLRRGPLRMIGPNCLGISNPITGLNATFAQTIANAGNVAFLSQSGALLTAILDWSLKEKVGFSAFVSTGSMLDVGWGDLIDYFGDDPHTQSIFIYMESIGDARAFLSAAREVSLKKPIIVIKAGRTEAASKAASSHTGALTGSDEVFDAAFRRCGVLRVQSISDVFYMAEVLSRQPRPRGPRLMILTNAGGPAVLATDALIANGGELAALSDDSRTALNALLPPHWSHGNPIDILGDADSERYSRAVEVAINDHSGDGLLVILAPQGMTDPATIAKKLGPYAKGTGKPLIASWMGGLQVEAGKAILNEAGIPTFAYADTAARAFDYMWRYSYNLRGLYETPLRVEDPSNDGERRRKASEIIGRVFSRGRTLLTEFESKQILEAYAIPSTRMRLAQSAEEACSVASEIGFPVVLKINSETITHKTDVGGVKLNLRNEDDVRCAFAQIADAIASHAGRDAFQGVTVQPMISREGYELILGSTVDPQFGPVMLFGSGGQLVEVYRDRALAMPPLTSVLAHRMMEQTKVYRALAGVRGRAPVDLAALEALVVRFSFLILDLPRIKEIDINPLLASGKGLLALDARVVLIDAATADDKLPQAAIRPYPSQYAGRWKMRDGAEVSIRPIRPEDEQMMVRFHETLSEQTVYLRYFHMENLNARIAHDRLLRKCFIDYNREMALVVEKPAANGANPELLAIGRLARERNGTDGEIAILVTDKFQRSGIGIELTRRLIEIAKKEGYKRLVAHVLPENLGMRALAEHFGFVVQPSAGDGEIIAILTL
jgi:acetyltransferase